MPEQTKKTFFQDYQNLMKDVTALTKDKINPFFKSKFVPLKDVLAEAKRVCIANNFIFYQTTFSSGFVEISKDNIQKTSQPAMQLKTTLKHMGGDLIESIIPIVTKDINDPQKVGAGLTYMRRYSLTCILGIQELDDDGKKASKAGQPTLEAIVGSIRLVKDKKTLTDMQAKIKKGRRYNDAQKRILLGAITEQLKQCK